MKKLLVIFILFAIAYCLAKITVSSNIDDKQCDVFVQVNEDSDVIFLETMHIPGQYMTTACWGTVATMCHVKQDEVSYINGMKMNGTTTFLNNENQICYFENLGLSVGNMSGFYYQPWSYVYSVNIRVSCEDSSSVPQYCAKTEKMAKQVLLAKEELECEEKGGNFEGGVYQFKMPNDSIEYCVAGRCDVCHSQWYKKFVEHWKDSVCCETRGKEPNTNNGTCISPPPFDSTKIGVKHSNITAFPGCSKADAGTNNNFCYRSSSSSVSSSSVASSSSNISSSSISSSSAESSSSNDSSSSEDSSSSGDSSSSEESSSSNDSSSSEEPYSSSEEQEDANCHPNSSEAQATLHNAEAECWSMQMESGYQLDDNGCLTGECYGGIYSSDDDDESSSSSEWESSSSEERCIDISLLKESGDEEEDQSTYVGKEKYTSRTISYEEVTPSSGFFDALGRMYKTIKSKIKYFMGIDTKVKKTVEVGEEVDVWKRNFIDFNGNDVVSYEKRDREWNIFIDSSVYLDGTYSIIELNNKENYVRLRMTDGSEYYDLYDELNNLKKSYSISVDGDTLEEILNRYEPETDYLLNVNANMLKKISYEVDFGSKSSKNYSELLYICPDFKSNYLKTAAKDDPAPLSAICENPTKPASDFFEKSNGLIYYPGLRVERNGKIAMSATFGQLMINNHPDPPKTYYSCECLEKDVYVHSYRVDYQAYVKIYASNWIYDVEQKSWERKCWKKEDMQKTYNHEMGHYKNILIEYPIILDMFFTTKDNYKKKAPLKTWTECEEKMHQAYNWTARMYKSFSQTDRKHEGGIGNSFPSSPKPTSDNNREGRNITCSE